jgi:hypothetical protein
MFCCATLFFWAGVKPRETISGLFGRLGHSRERAKFWHAGRKFIDRLHPHEDFHCSETAICEKRMRDELYRCLPG